MDTIETNEPVGAEGATSSQDTSINDTQPTESTESVSDSNVEEVGEAPELLAGKYKTQEDLIKAHHELEQKLGEQGQKAELANLLERQTGMTHQQIKDYLANQQQQQLLQQQQENQVGYLMQKQQQLESQLALQSEEKALDKFLQENPAYTPFKDKILDLGLNLYNGNVKPEKSYADIANEYFGSARAQGQQDAYKKIDTKIMTQATGASQAPPKGKFTEEDMERMSVAELEAILPHADTSNRLY